MTPLLRTRIAALARDERYEEAADVRDRYRAVARALERRRAWGALRAAGTMWLEDAEGDGAIVSDGRLVASWNGLGAPPLVSMTPPSDAGPGVPVSVPEAEEAHLVWRWMNRWGVRLVDATGTLSLPSRPVPELG